MPVYLLSDELVFPPPALARKDGLLAVGGDLNPDRLLLAYRLGIFPWYSEGEPILWWSPDPRLVLYPGELRISKSLKKVIRRGVFRLSMDTAFEPVIRECAVVRSERGERTWITEEMIESYCKLHQSGFAHSVEVWQGRLLAGGLYGVSLGKCFFGESMFTRINNASKVALVGLTAYLKANAFDFIDCQVTTGHLLRIGAREIPRHEFLKQLRRALNAPTKRGRWHFDQEPII
ncbi:MAG: leucyl/phenylalanyl-tRNA--protein transferase [Deltaproteobacteria bacterium]|nr:leucyl/phenylalanyl-tRNA--protein transferase [Deltaproteobacteria bacterium]MBW1993902.1 leucyl/phenylalanyl-tRNA--protein transferase [Deltaproteobacteria bacterium]MBW2150456.1 leucyl/phenylalanyl-tRNA--protein transferase [Deltaproteobacteria bacterium]